MFNESFDLTMHIHADLVILFSGVLYIKWSKEVNPPLFFFLTELIQNFRRNFLCRSETYHQK